MGKHETQILRVLIEGFVSAFAILLFCMEMSKLQLIYGSGWYVCWIVGLTLITGAVWYLLETNIRISFDKTLSQDTTQQAVTTDSIRGMITQALYDLQEEPVTETFKEKHKDAFEEQYQPEISDDEVKVLSTRSVNEV